MSRTSSSSSATVGWNDDAAPPSPTPSGTVSPAVSETSSDGLFVPSASTTSPAESEDEAEAEAPTTHDPSFYPVSADDSSSVHSATTTSPAESEDEAEAEAEASASQFSDDPSIYPVSADGSSSEYEAEAEASASQFSDDPSIYPVSADGSSPIPSASTTSPAESENEAEAEASATQSPDDPSIYPVSANGSSPIVSKTGTVSFNSNSIKTAFAGFIALTSAAAAPSGGWNADTLSIYTVRPKDTPMSLDLLAMPLRRDLEERFPGTGTDPVDGTRRSYRVAALGYLVGAVSAPACSSCADGKGKFKQCIVVAGSLKEACASCYYANQPSRCSLRP